MAQDFSVRWFATFLDPGRDGEAALARQEVDAACAWLPQPGCRRVLDLCCGPGRHSEFFASRGLEVTGLDRDHAALAAARQRVPQAHFVHGDQRDVARIAPGPFDAVLCLWQSFGFFDAAGNDAVLAGVAQVLRPGGRFVVDLFRRGWVAAHGGVQEPLADGTVSTFRDLGDGRWQDLIRYPDGETDTLKWELFEPEDLVARAARAGFAPVATLHRWQPVDAVTADAARFQVVLERHPLAALVP